MIDRQKKLSSDKDLTARNVEDIFTEVANRIPTEDDYRVVSQTKKTVGKVIPEGLRDGEILIDSSDTSSVKLTVRVGSKMYKVDLTEL